MAREPQFAQIDNDGHRVVSPLVGKPVKLDATLLDTHKTLNLSDYRGKVVVLDFWASWCAPCIRSMPNLIATVGEFPNDKVQLIAVNQGEDLNTVSSVVEAKGWQVQVALDSLGSASRSLKIEALPQTVLVNQDGKVAAVFLGASGRLHEELKLAIEILLGE
jgi:thiol-disulfide isomerase/thioredoxin